MTNDSKHNSSLSNEVSHNPRDVTWNEATQTWNDIQGTWNTPTFAFTNDPKHVASDRKSVV